MPAIKLHKNRQMPGGHKLLTSQAGAMSSVFSNLFIAVYNKNYILHHDPFVHKHIS